MNIEPLRLRATSLGVWRRWKDKRVVAPFGRSDNRGRLAHLGAHVHWIEVGGLALEGWLLSPARPRCITLFLPGRKRDVDTYRDRVRCMVQAGSAVLALNYRGYGRSGGTPTRRGMFADARAAYRHLVENGIDPNWIVIHGFCLGSRFATSVAARNGCAALVLDAAFTSLYELVWWPFNTGLGFDTKRALRKLRKPLLILYGDEDRIVQTGHDENLLDEAQTDQKWRGKVSVKPSPWWWPRHGKLTRSGCEAYVRHLRRFYTRIGLRPRAAIATALAEINAGFATVS